MMGIFVLSLFFAISVALMNPLRAWFTQYTIDHEIAQNPEIGLMNMGWILLSILIIQSFFQYGQGMLTARIGQGIILSLRKKVFHHIGRSSFSHLDKTPVGTLVTRSISDMETLAEVFSEGAINIIGDVLQILCIIALMIYQDWKLTLVSLSVLPLLMYAGFVFKNAVKNSFTQTRLEVTRLNTFVQEHLQGMSIIQIFNREKEEYSRFEKINKAHRVAQNKGVMAYSIFFPVVELVMAISTAALIGYGILHISGMPDGITLGMLTAFILLINQFFRPVRQLADRFNSLQMGMVAAERIFQLLDETETLEQDQGKLTPSIKGKVSFHHVYSGYKEGQDVLKDIHFSVSPGTTLAIVGPTGAGKTTIIGLLNRFYSVRKGQIYIDDIPIEDISLTYLRSHIGLIMQDVFLFSGSIFENLTLGNDQITMQKVIEVCHSIGLHEYINALPGGYHHLLQERGHSLSSGQRQLLAFARTMLANPEIIIMDEATAHVDTYAEELIQKATAVLMKGRTCLVIAHRLSTIRNANEIMVVEDGKIIEKGNHLELWNAEGLYRRLCEKQFDAIVI